MGARGEAGAGGPGGCLSLAGHLGGTLATSRPVEVLERSLRRDRLAHAILLHGGSLAAVEEVALALAAALLGTDPEGAGRHPDCFRLRPANKMRQIDAKGTRALVSQIQHSSNQGGAKVALVYEADRMHPTAANIFLKTLEEPPAGTTILLLTTRPYDLLDTIRSRTVNFRLPAARTRVDDPAWQGWCRSYRDWLEKLVAGASGAPAVADVVLQAYGLLSRFLAVLTALGDAAWAAQKAALPEGLEDEQAVALEVGVRRGVRARLFGEVARETRAFALGGGGGEAGPLKVVELSRASGELERVSDLLAANLQEVVALEHFFLRSLRFWFPRGR